MLKGVDVASPYQNASYDVTGLSFAFVKATQGTGYVNPLMGAQLQHAESHGLVTGVYLFMDPAHNPHDQAVYFHAHAIVKAGTMIAVDWESLHSKWPSNADKDALIHELKGLYPHNKVGLYTNLDGWLNHDRTSVCGDFLWIADPGTAGKVSIKHAWTFHQWGIRGNIDQDVANFPDLNSLKRWAGMTTPTPPAKPPVTPPAFNPRTEPGFNNWAYKNPPTEADAWARLKHVETMLVSLCQHFGVPH